MNASRRIASMSAIAYEQQLQSQENAESRQHEAATTTATTNIIAKSKTKAVVFDDSNGTIPNGNRGTKIDVGIQADAPNITDHPPSTNKNASKYGGIAGIAPNNQPTRRMPQNQFANMQGHNQTRRIQSAPSISLAACLSQIPDLLDTLDPTQQTQASGDDDEWDVSLGNEDWVVASVKSKANRRDEIEQAKKSRYAILGKGNAGKATDDSIVRGGLAGALPESNQNGGSDDDEDACKVDMEEWDDDFDLNSNNEANTATSQPKKQHEEDDTGFGDGLVIPSFLLNLQSKLRTDIFNMRKFALHIEGTADPTLISTHIN